MHRDALIDMLASDVKPVRPGSVGRRIALGMVAGGVVTLILIALTLGINPDLAETMLRYHFWVKWIYCLSLGVLAIVAIRRLARPDGKASDVARWLAVPVILLLVIGVVEMVHTPSREWLAMWLGQSWRECPWTVLAAAMPILAGLLWSFRRFAPTRLREAGAAAGLAAGAFSATLYCLHCPEASAIFVLTWYTLGIVLATAVGALMGPRLLRW